MGDGSGTSDVNSSFAPDATIQFDSCMDDCVNTQGKSPHECTFRTCSDNSTQTNSYTDALEAGPFNSCMDDCVNTQGKRPSLCAFQTCFTPDNNGNPEDSRGAGGRYSTTEESDNKSEDIKNGTTTNFEPCNYDPPPDTCSAPDNTTSSGTR